MSYTFYAVSSEGLLTGAICGDVFASPPSNHVLAALERKLVEKVQVVVMTDDIALENVRIVLEVEGVGCSNSHYEATLGVSLYPCSLPNRPPMFGWSKERWRRSGFDLKSAYNRPAMHSHQKPGFFERFGWAAGDGDYWTNNSPCLQKCILEANESLHWQNPAMVTLATDRNLSGNGWRDGRSDLRLTTGSSKFGSFEESAPPEEIGLTVGDRSQAITEHGRAQPGDRTVVSRRT
ncbi:unnamed protein product, partial [Mesorhabditis belari]|uniref:Uncharacterized protein n=1 Tax=Mesorhabditis belari TaxID=2138241 RepID=A0AAF3EP79_9BILA